MGNPKQSLRFAALIRVSTEKQERCGESLKTQESRIRKEVENREGILIEECIYKGQEHSTPGCERELFERLLHDAARNKFDAVIVDEQSRWARDNQKSKIGLKILKENGIRFFDVHGEYDLHDPHDVFILGIQGEINEWFAAQLSGKSMQARHARAKRGFASFGSRHFGYKFNEKDGHPDCTVIPLGTVLMITMNVCLILKADVQVEIMIGK